MNKFQRKASVKIPGMKTADELRKAGWRVSYRMGTTGYSSSPRPVDPDRAAEAAYAEDYLAREAEYEAQRKGGTV